MRITKRILKRTAVLVGVTALFLGYQNCDNVQLSLIQPPAKVESQGMICAQPPTNLTNLNRFLFMVDNSGSITGLDQPDANGNTRRVTALNNFINEHQADPNFTIALGSLSNDYVGYLPDPAAPALPALPVPQASCKFYSPSNPGDYNNLQTGLQQLQIEADTATGSTPFNNVYNSMYSCLQADIAVTSGAQYNVVVVTDGAPTDETITTFTNQVTQLIKLGVAQGATTSSINLFFVYLDSYDDSPEEADFISASVSAAQQAGGLFSKSITVGATDPINYDNLGIIRNPRYRLKQLVVTNMNTAIEDDGTLGVDSDSDGIPDDKEIRLGLNPVDYAGNGKCGDLVYTRNQNSCPSSCNTNLLYLDTDQDGLSDCDESIIGSNPFLVDTDGDGIPDELEYKLGLSPIDPKDRDLDPDGDGVTNYQEAMRMTSPYHNDNQITHKSLQTTAIQEFQQSDGTYCYNVSVQGMQVFPTKGVSMNTLPQLLHDDNENIIRYLFFEVPDDNPSATPVVLQAYDSVYYQATQNGIIDIDDITTNDFSFVSDVGQ